MGRSDKPALADYPHTLAPPGRGPHRVRRLPWASTEPISLVVHDWGGADRAVLGGRAPRPRRQARPPQHRGLPAARRTSASPGRCRPRGCPSSATSRCAGSTPSPWARWRWAAVGTGSDAEARRGLLAPYDSPAHRVAVHAFVQDIPTGPDGPGPTRSWSASPSACRCSTTSPIQIHWGMKDPVFDGGILEHLDRVLPARRGAPLPRRRPLRARGRRGPDRPARPRVPGPGDRAERHDRRGDPRRHARRARRGPPHPRRPRAARGLVGRGHAHRHVRRRSSAAWTPPRPGSSPRASARAPAPRCWCPRPPTSSCWPTRCCGCRAVPVRRRSRHRPATGCARASARPPRGVHRGRQGPPGPPGCSAGARTRASPSPPVASRSPGRSRCAAWSATGPDAGPSSRRSRAARAPRPRSCSPAAAPGPPKGVEHHEDGAARPGRSRSATSTASGPATSAWPTFPPFALFGPALGMTTVVPRMDPTRPAKVVPGRASCGPCGTLRRDGHVRLPRPARPARAAAPRRAPACRPLRQVISAGAPVPRATQRRVLALLGPARRSTPPTAPPRRCRWPPSAATNCSTCPTTGSASDDPCRASTSRSCASPTGRWTTLTPDLLVAPGEVGEVVVRGPVVSPAYADRPEATAAAKLDWDGRLAHRMGDLAVARRRGPAVVRRAGRARRAHRGRAAVQRAVRGGAQPPPGGAPLRAGRGRARRCPHAGGRASRCSRPASLTAELARRAARARRRRPPHPDDHDAARAPGAARRPAAQLQDRPRGAWATGPRQRRLA